MKNPAILLLLVLASCITKINEGDLIQDFPETIKLRGERLEIPLKINRAFDIIILNNSLLISDSDGEYLFKVINLNKTNEVYSFGKIGDGPCEFFFPTSIQILSEKSRTLGLFNRKNWKYQEISLSEEYRNNQVNCLGEASKPFNPNFQKILNIQDSLFLGIGIFGQKYNQSILNSKNENLLPIEYPFTEGVPQSGEIAMSQQGELFKQPNGNNILITSKYSPFFDILEYSNDQFRLVKRSEGWAPSRIKSQDENTLSSNLKKDNKFGYIGASVSQEFIYLLFSGKDFSHDPYTSKTIFKYNWKGEKVSKYILDKEVNLIAVSSDNKFFITYHDDGMANFTKYELK